MDVVRLEGKISYVENSQPVNIVYLNPLIAGEIKTISVELYDQPTVIGLKNPNSFLTEQFEFFGNAPANGLDIGLLHISQGWAGLHCHRYAFFHDTGGKKKSASSGVYFPVSDSLVGHLTQREVQKVMPAYKSSSHCNPLDVSSVLRTYLDVLSQNSQ